jgi:hypothetical protein
MLPIIKEIQIIDPYALALNGGDNKHKIDIGQHFRYLSLYFYGIFTVGGFACTLTPWGILNLIKDIRVKLGSSTSIKSISAKMLYCFNLIDHKFGPVLDQPSVNVGANVFAFELVIPFSSLEAKPEDYTILNSNKLKSGDNKDFTINFLLGNETDVATAGGGGTIAITNINCMVSAQILENYPSNIYRPLNLEEMKGIATPFAGAGTFKSIYDLKSGNKVKRIGLISEIAGVPDDTVIGQIQLRTGVNTLREDVDWYHLRAINQRKYGVVPPVGFACLELDKVGNYSNLLDTQLEAQAYIDLIILNAGQVTCSVKEIIT